MKSGIYNITNTITGKFYVGSTFDFERRWMTHKRDLNIGKHCNDYLQKSWDKYGKDSFSFEVIEKVSDKSKLLEREQYYLDVLKPYLREIGYNISEKAKGGNLGLESNKRISKALKGRKFSKDHCLKISKSSRGKIISSETKEKMSCAHLGKSPWNKGIKTSDDVKKKIGKSLKGRVPWNKKKLTDKEINKIILLHQRGNIFFTELHEMFHIGKKRLNDILINAGIV